MSVFLKDELNSLTISNSTFKGISNFLSPGLLDVNGQGRVLIENSHFEGLQAKEGGAFRFNDQLQVEMINSSFLENRAALGGGVLSALN